MGSLHAVFFSLLVISIIVGSANGDIYDGGSYDSMTPKLAKDQERLLSTMIGIEGIILYKFGSSISPLQGKLYIYIYSHQTRSLYTKIIINITKYYLRYVYIDIVIFINFISFTI